MQLESQAGLEERARHPVRRKTEQTAGRGKLRFDFGLSVGGDGLELVDGAHGSLNG